MRAGESEEPTREPERYETPLLEDLGTLPDLTRGDEGGTPDITIAGSQ